MRNNLMAEMVGVEPTRPCGPIAFRVRPLQPLEYISKYSLTKYNSIMNNNFCKSQFK